MGETEDRSCTEVMPCLPKAAEDEEGEHEDTEDVQDITEEEDVEEGEMHVQEATEDEDGVKLENFQEFLCLEDDPDFFSVSLPQAPVFFFISRCAWNNLRKKQSKDHFKGLQWTNVISAGIGSIHPYCSFAFTGHRVKVKGSRLESPLFTCSAYCMFQDCPAEVDVVVDSEAALKACVSFRGATVVHSHMEIQRWPIRADGQKQLNKQLKTTLPRAHYLEQLAQLEESVFLSGCRDEAPSPAVLKTVLETKTERQERQ